MLLGGFLDEQMDAVPLFPQGEVHDGLPGVEVVGGKVDAMEDRLPSCLYRGIIHGGRGVFLRIAHKIIYHLSIGNCQRSRYWRMQSADAAKVKVGGPVANNNVVHAVAVPIYEMIIGNGILAVICGDVWPPVGVCCHGSLVDEVGVLRDVDNGRHVLTPKRWRNCLAVGGMPCASIIGRTDVINAVVGPYIIDIVAPKPRQMYGVVAIHRNLPIWTHGKVVFYQPHGHAAPLLFGEQIAVDDYAVGVAVHKHQVAVGKIVERGVSNVALQHLRTFHHGLQIAESKAVRSHRAAVSEGRAVLVEGDVQVSVAIGGNADDIVRVVGLLYLVLRPLQLKLPRLTAAHVPLAEHKEAVGVIKSHKLRVAARGQGVLSVDGGIYRRASIAQADVGSIDVYLRKAIGAEHQGEY